MKATEPALLMARLDQRSRGDEVLEHMKIAKIVAQSILSHAKCLTCDDLDLTDNVAEGRAWTHAQENDGHRVKVTNTEFLIYERKEMT